MTPSISTEEPIARRRMPSILAVGVLFLALGVLDVYRGVAPLFGTASALATDDMQVLAIGIAALVGGSFVLRGHNWARWLLAVWMLLHVAISVGEPDKLIAHLLIFGFLAFLLFRPRARLYFRPAAANYKEEPLGETTNKSIS
jgi:hypothetical protein